VVNFPFPTAPDRLQLRLAEKRLQTLGILEVVESKNRRRDDEEVSIRRIIITSVLVFGRHVPGLRITHKENGP
jgi:hypothetical protein